MAWTDFNCQFTIKIGANTHTLTVGKIEVRAVPYVGDSPAYIQDISGSHVDLFVGSPQWHFKIDLEWTEHLDEYPDFWDMFEELYQRSAVTDVYFCIVEPFDATKQLKVIPMMDDDAIKMLFESKIRKRPSTLKLITVDTVATIPDWLRI